MHGALVTDVEGERVVEIAHGQADSAAPVDVRVAQQARGTTRNCRDPIRAAQGALLPRHARGVRRPVPGSQGVDLPGDHSGRPSGAVNVDADQLVRSDPLLDH